MNGTINMNDMVYVELTETGWGIIKSYYANVYRNYGIIAETYVSQGVEMYRRYTNKYLVDRWRELTRFQLHELMLIFGGHCVVGGTNDFFKGNTVYLSIDVSTKLPNKYEIDKWNRKEAP